MEPYLRHSGHRFLYVVLNIAHCVNDNGYGRFESRVEIMEGML